MIAIAGIGRATLNQNVTAPIAATTTTAATDMDMTERREFGVLHVNPFTMTYLRYAFRLQPAILPPVTGEMPNGHVLPGVMTRHRDPLEHPNFQFSRCTGRKRAVCVSLRHQTVPNVPLSQELLSMLDWNQLHRPKQPARWLHQRCQKHAQVFDR